MPGRPTGRPLLALLLSLLALPSLPAELPGQETESPLSPAGRLRLQVAPAFESWDSRYGERTESGVSVEGEEPLAFDLDGRDAVDFFPGVPDLEGRIAAIVGDDAFDGALGSTRIQASAERVRLPFRLDLGVLDRVTVGVTVPLVKNRTEVAFHYDSTGANLGANPALTDPALVGDYLGGLGDARTAARERATALCSESPGSGACLTATELADDVESFHGDLVSAYGASFLFPTAATDAGTALRDRSSELDTRLETAGLAGLDRALPLATAVNDRETFDQLVRRTLGTDVPATMPGLWELGDVEVHALVRLASGVRRDTVSGDAWLRWEVGAGGLVRLGTGSTDDPAVLLDLPSGEGQTDVEGRVFANLTWHRLGLWTDIRYGVQTSRKVARRIGPPDVLLRAPSTRAVLEWTPGSYLALEVAPRYHLTDELAFAGGYRLWSKAEDAYERLSAVPDPPAEPWIPRGPYFEDTGLLERETAETRHEVGAGLVYNTLDAWREGRAPVPLEGRLTLRWSVAGSGGATPAPFVTGFALRIYHRIWGR